MEGIVILSGVGIDYLFYSCVESHVHIHSLKSLIRVDCDIAVWDETCNFYYFSVFV